MDLLKIIIDAIADAARGGTLTPEHRATLLAALQPLEAPDAIDQELEQDSAARPKSNTP